MNTKGKRNLLKRIMALAVAVVMTLGLVPCMSIKTSAEGGTSAKNDTGKWVTNSDGTLSIDSTAAENAVKEVRGQVSLVLIGTIGGKITLPTSSFDADVTYKISDEGDAALVLYKNKVDKSTIISMLPDVKFESSVSAVKISVTDGDTKGIDVSSGDTTFGIMGVDGEAHIYKFVQGSKSWADAYHEAVSGSYVLGGFKGYLATVTTDVEKNRLNSFYISVTDANEGGWIAATSLRYSPDTTITSYDAVADLIVTPDNHDTYTTYSKVHTGNVNKVTTNNGAYYWTDSNVNYMSYYYWACGPEMGDPVTGGYATGEPNNYNTPTLGECCTVASYNKATTFNDYPINQNVAGYFLEFSVYNGGLENDSVTYKTTTIYRVSYDKNGATGGTVPNVQAKFLNQALTLATNTGNLTRGEDLGFNGWNTQADGKGTHYDAGATYAADNNASLTLYAEWVDNPAKPPTVERPKNISLEYGYAENTDIGKLSVKATPDSGAAYDLTYQWYSNTANSNEDGILIDGATSATYSIPKGLDIGEHYYYCIVTATKTDDQNKKAATASAAATVTVVKAPAKISYETSSVKIAFGDDFTNGLTNTGDGAVSYGSSNTNVATVDGNGEVKIVGAGGAEITATAQDGTRYYYGSGDNKASYTLTVDKAAVTPVVSMADYTYGTEVVPAPAISGNSGNGAVTYYYNTTESNTGGTEWIGINGKTLSVGTYYMYAVVEETENHKAATSAPDSFEVKQAANEVTVNIEDWTYGDTAKEPSVTADFGADTVQYTYYTDESCIEMTKVADGAASEGEVPSYPGTYWIKAEIPATGNYAGAEGKNSFTINKKAVTITAKPQTIDYGGQIKNDISEAVTESLAADDSLTSISLTASTENATADGKVTPSEATIKKGETDVTARCYEITYAEGNLTINKVDPTVTPPTANDLTYNGVSQELISAGSTEHGTLSYAVTTTDSAPQDDEFTYNNDNLPEKLNAGTYYVWYKVTGDDNHNNTAALSVQVTITKKAVKITADDAEKVYDGTELTCDTYTNSELAEGDSIVNVTVTGSQTVVGSSDNSPSDAVITDGNGEIATDNYDIQYVNGKLEVTKKAVTVTTDDSSKIFGEKDPEFTFKTDGLVGEEALEGITLSREAGEDAGEYIISAESSEEKNTNYDITFDNKGKLTIAAKDVTPSVDKIEDKYYTGKEISPEMVVKDGDDIIPVSEYTFKYKDNVETGKATAIISDVKGGNYNIAETTVNFNILPRGEVEVTEPAEENDCKGKLDEEETAVISKVELSADDQSALDTGKNVSIFLEVQTINDKVSAEDKAVVEETAKNNETGSELTVGWYLDVSLFKQIFGEDKVKITETNGAVGITIEIPESLRKDGRTFYVIRVHDGAGEIIPSKQEGNFIRFTTDRFSTYALAYVDKTDADGASVKPADVRPADGSSAKSDDGLSEVHTGDDTNVLLIFLLMIDSGLAAVYFALQKKVKERRNR